MAVVRPLRGLRYDPARTAVSRALAPPYDVIDEVQRERLYALGPHNIVRVDFGKPVAWLGLPAVEAAQLGALLIAKAKEIGQ